MREIKIKFWDSINKIMVYPKFTIKNLMEGRKFSQEEIEKFTPLLFTGLFDKRGKEIYEGDILKLHKSGTCKVYWNENKGAFYHEWLSGACKKIRINHEPIISPFALEIIGNIHKATEEQKKEWGLENQKRR